MRIFPSFNGAIDYTSKLMRDISYEVRPSRWQSSDVSKRPEALMRETLNVSFQVSLGWNENLEHYRKDIQPNLPWADDHFLERVSGKPLNPGVQWANWPWALSADKFRTENGGKFSHTYMERYWPKMAHEPTLPGSSEYSDSGIYLGENKWPRRGIRYEYGDLNDVVNHLLADPGSRQAYLPVWFPEDTGVVHGERVPCSLGYHWILRGEHLHTTYYIRSCDFYRHFRDDLYLTARLTLWLLDQLREREINREAGDKPAGRSDWQQARAGLFTFHCVSMHMFINDWNKLFGGK